MATSKNVLNDLADVRAARGSTLRGTTGRESGRGSDGTVLCRLYVLNWARRRHRVHHLTGHRTIVKEESVVTNSKRINHQACSSLQNSSVITSFREIFNSFHKQSIKVILTENLSKLVNHITIKVRL